MLAQVDEAAHFAKADLLTDMVGEFPELQGIMGGYYARHDGLSEAVAFAIEDHYKPRFAGDELPRNVVGLIVALADKLETLVGLFGIGQLPTGDKDPFALRRHALGVVRMLSERAGSLSLDALIKAAVPAFGSLIQDPGEALSQFIFERLSGTLREQGFSAKQVDAVLALRPQRLADVTARLNAVREFEVLPEAASLAAANKRIGNILKKSEQQSVEARVDDALLQEAAERALAAALKDVAPKAEALFNQGEYAASLRELAALKTPVDAFFDGVMVNADDPALRANRLGLLKTLHEAMNRVADLSASPPEDERRLMRSDHSHSMKLVILGRDGVLNHYRDDHVKSVEELEPLPGALEAVARLNHAGWHTVMATNQPGIGRGLLDMSSLNAVHMRLNQLLAEKGGRLDAVFFCPHTPEEGCNCRKPLPGLIEQIGERFGVDLPSVHMAGVSLRDLMTARNAGCAPHLIRSEKEGTLEDGPPLAAMLAEVPGAQVHASITAFAEHLVQRDRRAKADARGEKLIPDTGPGVL